MSEDDLTADELRYLMERYRQLSAEIEGAGVGMPATVETADRLNAEAVAVIRRTGNAELAHRYRQAYATFRSALDALAQALVTDGADYQQALDEADDAQEEYEHVHSDVINWRNGLV